MSDFFNKPWEHWVDEYGKSHQHPLNRLCHKIGIPVILVSLPLMALGIWSASSLYVGIGLFILGWALQFVGHIFEGKPPEFFRDWRFLFVGVRWWLKSVTKK